MLSCHSLLLFLLLSLLYYGAQSVGPGNDFMHMHVTSPPILSPIRALRLYYCIDHDYAAGPLRKRCPILYGIYIETRLSLRTSPRYKQRIRSTVLSPIWSEQSARTDLNSAMIMTCKVSIYHEYDYSSISLTCFGGTDYGDEISLDSNKRRVIGAAQKRRKCYGVWIMDGYPRKPRK